jgi:hypothetical protein
MLSDEVKSHFYALQAELEQKLIDSSAIAKELRREIEELKRELTKAYSLAETIKVKTAGPLLAKLRIQDALISHIEKRDKLLKKKLAVVSSTLRLPRMYTEFRKA